jgi:anthranilate synthase component 1
MIHHRTVLADLLTPVTAYLRVASGSRRAFLLESVEGGEKIARYSFIGVDPIRSFDGTFAEFRRAFPPPEPPHPGLPPFAGGAVGCFNYEMVREFERLPDNHPDLSRPPAVQMDFYTTVLAFDHLKHQIVIMSHESGAKVSEIEERLQQISPLERRLPGGRFEPTAARPDSQPGSVPGWQGVTSNFSAEDFCAAVEQAKEYIRAGDIFQVVLSQAFEAEFAADPFHVYRALRYINPSPYMFFLKREDTCIVGASPEMLVRVLDRNLEYRPIAGTRRRGATPEADRRLEEELVADPKEKAEHLMLVDLGRNDLGRVSEFGQVEVERFMFVEKYSHVMHLVSALRGRLRPELDRFDALAACFPAGTVTGAPKVRAMEIIEELEPCPRGTYAGAIGYLDYSGNLDTCIGIRTLALNGGRARFQAGAGIVADSIPERENLECHNKARALVQALDLAAKLE